MRRHSGFTLIELMTVLGIIGILTAIAVPVYQEQMARAQISEGLVLAGGLKTAVTEYFSTEGILPASLGDLPQHPNGGASQPGHYVSAITISDAGHHPGTIVVTLDTARVTGIGSSSNQVALQPKVDQSGLIWACGPAAVHGVSTNLLPSTCHDNIGG